MMKLGLVGLLAWTHMPVTQQQPHIIESLTSFLQLAAISERRPISNDFACESSSDFCSPVVRIFDHYWFDLRFWWTAQYIRGGPSEPGQPVGRHRKRLYRGRRSIPNGAENNTSADASTSLFTVA